MNRSLRKRNSVKVGMCVFLCNKIATGILNIDRNHLIVHLPIIMSKIS